MSALSDNGTGLSVPVDELTYPQGDQIGRVFACLVIDFYWEFFWKFKILPNVLTKMGWATFRAMY
jgi:hypothetical protein